SVRHLARRRSALASPCRRSLAPKPAPGWCSARRCRSGLRRGRRRRPGADPAWLEAAIHRFIRVRLARRGAAPGDAMDVRLGPDDRSGELAAGPAGGELRSPVDLRRVAGVRRSGAGDARLHRWVLLDPGLVRSLAEPVTCVFPNRWRTSPSPLWG